ncbi:MAG: hypothetical protein JRH20_03585 [Deltaproteobacteria bacterium]|nr:hypothetical protein [Deltaproteobacteria bacterium]
MLFWLVGLLALALGLCSLPLLGVFGFEFSLALGLVASFAGAHIGAFCVTMTREHCGATQLDERTPGRLLGRLLLRAMALSQLLLVLPLLVVLLNALRVGSCAPLTGLAFFILLPVLSTSIAAAVGVFWGLLLSRPKLAVMAAMGVVAGSLGWSLYRFYTAPAIFAFDPFAGYFPGALYDEDIRIPAALLYARLYHISWITTLLGITIHLLDPLELRLRLHRLLLPQGWALVFTAFALALALPLTLHRAELGFSIDTDAVQRALGGVRHTSHFSIHYPRRFSPQQVASLVDDHEFRYAQLARVFGEHPHRIHSYIFSSSEQKRRLMGAANTLIAKPWRHEVYLQATSFPYRALKHELAHVFAGPHGDATFGVSLRWRFHGPLPYPHFNVGLIEGVAVATDWSPAGELSPHQRAAALFRLGLAPPIQRLFGLGFLSQAGGRSYALAGSFTRFLLTRHGPEPLLRCYGRAGDFQAIYGHSLSTLITQWRVSLRELEIPQGLLQLERERLRRPAIFHRLCPHLTANLRQDARSALAQDEPERALAVVERLCHLEPGEPSNLLRLAQTRAIAQGPKAAIAVLRQLLEHLALSKPLRRRVLAFMGDLHWLNKRPKEAQKRYREAASFAARPGDRRLLALKRWALSQADPLRSGILGYLVRPLGAQRERAVDVLASQAMIEQLRDRAHEPVDPLAAQSTRQPSWAGVGHYLLAKALANGGHCSLSIEPMHEALGLGLPTGDFRREAWRVLGRCRYLAGDLSGADVAFARLASLAPAGSEGIKLEAADWRERVAWRQNGRLLLHAIKRGEPGSITGSRLSSASTP